MSEQVLAIDAALEAKVNALVEKKVNESFQALESQISLLQSQLSQVSENQASDNVTILVFSGDMDKLLSAFIIATGAAAMGKHVTMYFTFWGLTALKKRATFKNKPITEKLITLMTPNNVHKAGVSKMHWMGAGTQFFKQVMKNKNVEKLPDLIDLAHELEIKMVACQMAMDVMGITKEELRDDLEYGGVITYLGDALNSQLTLMV